MLTRGVPAGVERGLRTGGRGVSPVRSGRGIEDPEVFHQRNGRIEVVGAAAVQGERSRVTSGLVADRGGDDRHRERLGHRLGQDQDRVSGRPGSVANPAVVVPAAVGVLAKAEPTAAVAGVEVGIEQRGVAEQPGRLILIPVAVTVGSAHGGDTGELKTLLQAVHGVELARPSGIIATGVVSVEPDSAQERDRAVDAGISDAEAGERVGDDQTAGLRRVVPSGAGIADATAAVLKDAVAVEHVVHEPRLGLNSPAIEGGLDRQCGPLLCGAVVAGLVLTVDRVFESTAIIVVTLRPGILIDNVGHEVEVGHALEGTRLDEGALRHRRVGLGEDDREGTPGAGVGVRGQIGAQAVAVGVGGADCHAIRVIGNCPGSTIAVVEDLIEAVSDGLRVDVLFIVMARDVAVFFKGHQRAAGVGGLVEIGRVAVPIDAVRIAHLLVAVQVDETLFDRHVDPVIVGRGGQNTDDRFARVGAAGGVGHGDLDRLGATGGIGVILGDVLRGIHIQVRTGVVGGSITEVDIEAVRSGAIPGAAPNRDRFVEGGVGVGQALRVAGHRGNPQIAGELLHDIHFDGGGTDTAKGVGGGIGEVIGPHCTGVHTPGSGHREGVSLFVDGGGSRISEGGAHQDADQRPRIGGHGNHIVLDRVPRIVAGTNLGEHLADSEGGNIQLALRVVTKGHDLAVGTKRHAPVAAGGDLGVDDPGRERRHVDLAIAAISPGDDSAVREERQPMPFARSHLSVGRASR